MEIFKPTQLAMQRIEGLLLDSLVKFLDNKINFDLIYTEKIKQQIQDDIFYKIEKIYKLEDDGKTQINIYLDAIYYKVADKAVKISEKRIMAESTAIYEEQAKEILKRQKQEKEEKKSLWRRFWET